MSIKLGDKVKDSITGFEGIVIARIEYLNGCIQFGVKARVKDATLKEAEYIDKDQLTRLGPGLNKADNAASQNPHPVSSRARGGFQPDGPQRKKRQRKGYY